MARVIRRVVRDNRISRAVRRYPVLAAMGTLTTLIATIQPPTYWLPFRLLVSFFAAAVILAPILFAIDLYRIRNGTVE